MFSLTNELVEILGLLEQGDSDESELERQLEEVATLLASKAERCAWTIRDIQRLAEERKTQARDLNDQAARLEREVTRLKLRLRDAMQSTGQERIVTGRYNIRLQNSPPRVEVLAPELVPSEFQRTKIIVDVDKTAVREHWKSSGEIVSGCDIVRDRHVVIS